VLSLDVIRFSREMSERRYAARVREDFLSGVRSGVNGTPTFFINGVRYNGSYDLGSLLATIRRRRRGVKALRRADYSSRDDTAHMAMLAL